VRPGRREGPAVDGELFTRAVFTLAESAGRLLLEHPDRWQVDQLADLARLALASLRP
jgi:hypothetical protein